MKDDQRIDIIIMLVNKIMSANVVTISVEAGLQEAAALMKEFDIRHLPVMEAGKLVGLVTERDVQGAFFPAMLEDISVKDLMVANPITVNPETMLEDAARLIYRHKIGCLPVVDQDGAVVGIVTVADLLASLIEVMGFLFASSRLDLILPNRAEALEEACRIIGREGGRIIGVSMTQLRQNQQTHLFRLHKTELESMVKSLDNAGFKVVSALP